jgi:Elongation factor Tu C-terminal domain
MTPEEFVKNFYLEQKSLVDLYLSSDNETDVSKLIADLQLDEQKTERLRQILNGALRDAFYTILLGLEGEAQMGERQETYKIEDESGNELTGGEIESYAWEYFHNNKFEFDNSGADFIATLTYMTTEQGGRKTAAKTGYRSQVKFDFDERQTSGQQTFIDRELVFPGDTVEAAMKILAVDHYANQLTEKMQFEFREGGTVIGTGIIKHIINDKLKKAGR